MTEQVRVWRYHMPRGKWEPTNIVVMQGAEQSKVMESLAKDQPEYGFQFRPVSNPVNPANQPDRMNAQTAKFVLDLAEKFPNDESLARFMRDSLRIGSIMECRALIKEARGLKPNSRITPETENQLKKRAALSAFGSQPRIMNRERPSNRRIGGETKPIVTGTPVNVGSRRRLFRPRVRVI